MYQAIALPFVGNAAGFRLGLTVATYATKASRSAGSRATPAKSTRPSASTCPDRTRAQAALATSAVGGPEGPPAGTTRSFAQPAPQAAASRTARIRLFNLFSAPPVPAKLNDTSALRGGG